MIQQSESLNELMAKVCWFPIGWEDKALEHGRELGELSAEVVEVRWSRSWNAIASTMLTDHDNLYRDFLNWVEIPSRK